MSAAVVRGRDAARIAAVAGRRWGRGAREKWRTPYHPSSREQKIEARRRGWYEREGSRAGFCVPPPLPCYPSHRGASGIIALAITASDGMGPRRGGTERSSLWGLGSTGRTREKSLVQSSSGSDGRRNKLRQQT